MNFPLIKNDNLNCGIAAMSSILTFYKIDHTLVEITNLMNIDEYGYVNLLSIYNAASKYKLNPIVTEVTFEDLLNVPLPAIVHLFNTHYTVAYHIDKVFIYISDSRMGLHHMKHFVFYNAWIPATSKLSLKKGIAMYFTY